MIISQNSRLQPITAFITGTQSFVANALSIFGLGFLFASPSLIVALVMDQKEVGFADSFAQSVTAIATQLFAFNLFGKVKRCYRANRAILFVILHLAGSSVLLLPRIFISVPLRGTGYDMSRHDWMNLNVYEMFQKIGSQGLDLATRIPRGVFEGSVSQLRILAGIQFSSPKFYPTLLPDEQYGQDGRSLTISVTNNTGTLSIIPNTSTTSHYRWVYVALCILSTFILEPQIRLWTLAHLLRVELRIRDLPDIARYGFVLRVAYIIASAIGIMLPLTIAHTLPFANYTSQLRSQIGLSAPDREISNTIWLFWDTLWLALFMSCDMHLLNQSNPSRACLRRVYRVDAEALLN